MIYTNSRNRKFISDVGAATLCYGMIIMFVITICYAVICLMLAPPPKTCDSSKPCPEEDINLRNLDVIEQELSQKLAERQAQNQAFGINSNDQNRNFLLNDGRHHEQDYDQDDQNQVKQNVEYNLSDSIQVAESNTSCINPHSFSYILKPKTNICSGDIFLFVFSLSAPGNFERRRLIRMSWGNPDNLKSANVSMRLVFILGAIPQNPATQNEIELESLKYGDILQEDFIDNYRNLTYKTAAALKYISKKCKSVKYVLKADDDMFVNIFTLVEYLQNLTAETREISEKLLIGDIIDGHPPERTGKYATSKDDYPGDRYPTFCSGPAYIMTSDVAHDLYNASLVTPFFWLEDVYFTGILAKKVGVLQKAINSAYSPLWSFNAVRGHIFSHDESKEINKFWYLWNKVAMIHGGVLLPSSHYNSESL